MTQPAADRVLVLKGAQTIRQAAQTREAILAALADSGDILLDCAGVEEADLSLVQIILAAQRSAASRSTRLALSEPPAGALRQALARGGFAPDRADPAAWAGQAPGAAS